MSEDKLIHQKIKNIRESLKLSQSRFGSKIGISGKTISAYERGLCIPSMRILEKISDIYGKEVITISSQNRIILLQKLATIKNMVKELEDKLIF